MYHRSFFLIVLMLTVLTGTAASSFRSNDVIAMSDEGAKRKMLNTHRFSRVQPRPPRPPKRLRPPTKSSAVFNTTSSDEENLKRDLEISHRVSNLRIKSSNAVPGLDEKFHGKSLSSYWQEQQTKQRLLEKRNSEIGIHISKPKVHPDPIQDDVLYRRFASRLAGLVREGKLSNPLVVERLKALSLAHRTQELPTELEEAVNQVSLVNISSCDFYEQETKTCWFDRQPGTSITLAVEVIGGENLLPDHQVALRWKRFRKGLKARSDILENISSGSYGNDSEDRLVVGNGGLRISPINNVDMDYNSYHVFAVASSSDRKEFQVDEIIFKINIIPIDMGYIHLGEELTIDIENFITLPKNRSEIRWVKESSVTTVHPLPPNMRVKNGGKTLVVSEVSNVEKGILACLVYDAKGYFHAKRRFSIRQPVLELHAPRQQNITIINTSDEPPKIPESGTDIKIKMNNKRNAATKE